MKAMLLTEYKKLQITDAPTPEIGEHEVLVRVGACGICGSDIHGFDGSSGRRIPPLIMGHEAAGEVAQVGSAVKDFKSGDRVTFDSMISCGRCAECRRGLINLCDHRRVMGVSCGDYRQHGAFAEYVAVPQHIVYHLPDSLPLEHAAMIEPVSVAVHATDLTPIKLGDTAVVVGTGMIGLLVIQTMKLAGCGRVIAVDIDDDKLAVAKKLGASQTVNAKTTDATKRVLEMTGGRGADIAVEVVGSTATLNTAVASVRKGGVVTLIGNLAAKVEMPMQAIVTRQITLIGSCGSCGQYPACIDLLASGRIDVRPLISATAPLEEGPAWFDRLYNHAPGVMKVILKP